MSGIEPVTNSVKMRRREQSPISAAGKSGSSLPSFGLRRVWPPVLAATAKRRRGSGVGRPIFSASGRTAKTSTRSRGCPRPCTLARAPKYTKRPLFVHPAALINEPPAPHRERQVAAKGGMLQTRSRPQSCGFRPPVLAAAASWSTMFRRRPALPK